MQDFKQHSCNNDRFHLPDMNDDSVYATERDGCYCEIGFEGWGGK